MARMDERHRALQDELDEGEDIDAMGPPPPLPPKVPLAAEGGLPNDPDFIPVVDPTRVYHCPTTGIDYVLTYRKGSHVRKLKRAMGGDKKIPTEWREEMNEKHWTWWSSVQDIADAGDADALRAALQDTVVNAAMAPEDLLWDEERELRDEECWLDAKIKDKRDDILFEYLEHKDKQNQARQAAQKQGPSSEKDARRVTTQSGAGNGNNSPHPVYSTVGHLVNKLDDDQGLNVMYNAAKLVVESNWRKKGEDGK
jgi:hypothetical protein